MTCALPDGIEVEFPRSGVRVRPYEGDVQLTARNYAEASFVFSEEAGNLIGSNVSTREPAIFKIDGNDVYRFMLPEDGLEFRRNFDKEDEAVVTFLDARAVLAGGTISKSWDDTEFNTIVSYILDNRDDPHGVITGTEYPDVNNPNKLIETTGDLIIDTDFSLKEFFNPLNLIGARHPSVPGIRFDDITPLKAMEKLTGELEYDFWVGIDGTLYVGLDQTWGQIIGVASDEKFSVRRFNVIESERKINQVIAKAPQQQLVDWFPDGALRVIGQATAPDISGASKGVGIKQGSTLEDIESIARRHLLREIMNDTSGSAVFNGLSSSDKEALGRITVGDQIVVDENAFARCNKSAPGGQYSITSVHHRINTRQGWRVDVDISRIPPEIKSEAFFYDPTDDKRYESVGAYKSDNIEEITFKNIL